MFNSLYNFDLQELIDSFDFFEFTKSKKHSYRSGILVITDEKYILSYTNNFGKGDHFSTLARILKDLNGGGNLNYRKAKNIIDEFKNNYIVSKLYFSYDDNNSGVMYFENLDNIDEKKYNSFLKFYNDYNDIIKATGIEANFFVSFYNNDTGNFVNSKSLDKLMRYLQNYLNNNNSKKLTYNKTKKQI